MLNALCILLFVGLTGWLLTLAADRVGRHAHFRAHRRVFCASDPGLDLVAQVPELHLLRFRPAAAHRIQRSHPVQVSAALGSKESIGSSWSLPLRPDVQCSTALNSSMPGPACHTRDGRNVFLPDSISTASLTASPVCARSCTSEGSSGTCTQTEPSNPSTSPLCQPVSTQSALRLNQVRLLVFGSSYLRCAGVQDVRLDPRIGCHTSCFVQCVLFIHILQLAISCTLKKGRLCIACDVAIAYAA